MSNAKQRVVELWQEGRTPAEIKKYLPQLSIGTIRVYCAQRSPDNKRPQLIRLFIREQTFKNLEEAAFKRGISARELAVIILHLVAEQDLINAVLDDGV